MTPPIRPEADDEFARWKAEQELKAWRAEKGRSPDAILRDLNTSAERSKRESDRLEKNAAEKAELGAPMSTSLVNALDMLTFGGAGLATDAAAAMGDGTFKANREARRMAKEGMSGYDRTLSTVAGALANPISTAARPFQGAGLLARTGNAATNTGAQALLTAGVENLDEFTPTGLMDAGVAGLKAGATGAALGAGGSLLYGAGRGARTLNRVRKAKPLDEAEFAIKDAQRLADDVNYGKVDAEIDATPSSPAIKLELESQTVKPYADMIRKSERWGGASDSRVLHEAYKLMSAAQRRAAKSIEGTPEFLADIELKTGDIGLAKKRLLRAAGEPDPILGIPGAIEELPKAVASHAKFAGEMDAFEMAADVTRNILTGKSVKGKGGKLLIDSPEALRRAIKEMTPGEAEAALKAMLGRAKEEFRITSNPLSIFGTVPSVARGIKLPGRINEYIGLLEAQAGRKNTGLLSDLFSPTMGRKAEGLLGITSGSSY